MHSVEIPVEAMLPRIIDARSFALTSAMQAKTPRIAQRYELSVYLEGDGVIIIGDETYPVHYGDIRFIKPGMCLYSKPSYRCYTVLFDFGENDLICRNQILDAIPVYFATKGAVVPLFEAIIKSHRSASIAEKLRANALLLQILYEIFSELHSKKAYSDAVRSCIGYMKAHYNEPITLETLGKVSGYSKIHIMRLFRKETGQTPHEYFSDMRINIARELLGTSNQTVEQIAEQCGFRSVAHFKVLFKKVTGLPPGSFRRNTNTF